MHRPPSCVALALLFTGFVFAGPTSTLRAAYSDAQIKMELLQTLSAGFAQWDRNHDGALDGREINALIENPQVRGNAAAAIVMIRNNLLFGGENMQNQKLPRDVVLALASDRFARFEFSRTRDRIQSGSRALFLPNDPNLFTFHQGRMGDCYLLSDFLDNGGSAGQVIEQLTGHSAASELLTDDGATKPAEALHKRLYDLARNRRLCIASTQRDTTKMLPKGIIHRHAIAMLGHDEKRRVVRMFNPWGNELAPAEPPGLVNGYVTHNGHFEVPLKEMARLFVALTFETDRPLSR